MSPEQLHNRPIDRRSDVFSLGIMLFEITTGTRLFKGENDVETMRLVLEGAVPAPSTHLADYPPELERIVLHALEKDPDRRYPSARALQLDLEAFARDNRLHVSSAALAEWMERTFGPKQELWRTLPLRPAHQPDPTPAASGGADPTGDTRVVPRIGGRNAGAVSQAAVEVPALEIKPATARRSARRVAMLGAAALAVAGVVWLVRSPSAADATAQAALPRAVIVAAEQGHVGLERDGAEEPRAQAEAPLPMPPPAGPAAAPSSSPTAGHRRLPTAHAADAAGFSAPFARREGDIRKCFDQHAEDAAGTSEISLRFQVRRDGSVSSVAALPEGIGARPLGACLSSVGMRTVFAPQPAAVTFRIPLTLHVKSLEKPRR